MKLTQKGYRLEVEAGTIALTEAEYNELSGSKKSIILEDSNFRIGSKGWKKKGELFENPEGDVWEIREGKYKGEQLFTWDAAMRETKKAGKRMPTEEEFVALYTDVIPDFPMVGYRDRADGSMINLGSYGNYWSSSVSGTYASFLYFNSTAVSPAYSNTRAYGFSVRCVQD